MSLFVARRFFNYITLCSIFDSDYRLVHGRAAWYGSLKVPIDLTFLREVNLQTSSTKKFISQEVTAGKDWGMEGRNYWRLVQTWGRHNGYYGSKFIIDGIPGPQSRLVEAAAYKKATEKKH